MYRSNQITLPPLPLFASSCDRFKKWSENMQPILNGAYDAFIAIRKNYWSCDSYISRCDVISSNEIRGALITNPEVNGYPALVPMLKKRAIQIRNHFKAWMTRRTEQYVEHILDSSARADLKRQIEQLPEQDTIKNVTACGLCEYFYNQLLVIAFEGDIKVRAMLLTRIKSTDLTHVAIFRAYPGEHEKLHVEQLRHEMHGVKDKMANKPASEEAKHKLFGHKSTTNVIASEELIEAKAKIQSHLQVVHEHFNQQIRNEDYRLGARMKKCKPYACQHRCYNILYNQFTSDVKIKEKRMEFLEKVYKSLFDKSKSVEPDRIYQQYVEDYNNLGKEYINKINLCEFKIFYDRLLNW